MRVRNYSCIFLSLLICGTINGQSKKHDPLKAKARVYSITNSGISVNTFIIPANQTTYSDKLIWLDAKKSTGASIYRWAYVTNTNPSSTSSKPTIDDSTAEQTSITGLTVGQYIFKLTVSATSKDSDIEYIPITIRNPASADTPTIQFVGNANIQPSLTSGSAIPANTGIGVIYRETLSDTYKWLYSIEMQVSINFASTVDTVKATYDQSQNVTNQSDFGNSLLLPLNSGQAFSFCFKGYLTQYDKNLGRLLDNGYPLAWGGIISGFYVNAAGSNRNWSNDTINVKASQMSFQGGLFHEFIKPSYRTNYSITLGFGYSGRWLAGDITEHTYDALREQLTGSSRKAFGGAEIIVGLRLKDIKAEFHIPFLSTRNAMPGLSGTQPSTLIGFTGGFSLQL